MQVAKNTVVSLQYELSDADGNLIEVQATVRYRGLEVGRVDDIVFDPRVTGQILLDGEDITGLSPRATGLPVRSAA